MSYDLLMEKIITVKDNHHFIIRPIKGEDKLELQNALLKLSSQSKSQRFFAMKNSFNEEELKFLTNVDDYLHMAYVAIHVDAETEDLEGAGVIRAIREKDCPHQAEIAMTIIDKYQGIGLGGRLLELISLRAEEKGVTEFVGSLQRTNTPMLRLLTKFTTFDTTSDKGAIIHFVAKLPFRA